MADLTETVADTMYRAELAALNLSLAIIYAGAGSAAPRRLTAAGSDPAPPGVDAGARAPSSGAGGRAAVLSSVAGVHGRRSTYVRGCRCLGCTAANTAYHRRRRELEREFVIADSLPGHAAYRGPDA